MVKPALGVVSAAGWPAVGLGVFGGVGGWWAVEANPDRVATVAQAVLTPVVIWAVMGWLVFGWLCKKRSEEAADQDNPVLGMSGHMLSFAVVMTGCFTVILAAGLFHEHEAGVSGQLLVAATSASGVAIGAMVTLAQRLYRNAVAR